MRDRFAAFMERMTRREKVLLAAMLAIFLVLTGGIGAALAVTGLQRVQGEIEALEDALRDSRRAAPDYLAAVGTERAIEERIKNNRIRSLRIPINDVAKKIRIEGGSSALADADDLTDLIRFEGKVVETPVLIGSARGRKKPRELKPGMYVVQQDQEVSIREIPLTSLYAFLEELERSNDLIFVTRLEIQRKFNSYENGRVAMVITTYVWPDEKG